MAKLKPVRRKDNLLDGLSDPKIMEEIGKTLDKNGRITTTIETDLIEIHSDNVIWLYAGGAK
jgi:hypothetical protein